MTDFTLTPESLPKPELGAPYSGLVTANGGVAPYQFSIAGGALPGGLVLAAGGAIAGTPTTVGTELVTIQAHDANGTRAEVTYRLETGDAPADPEVVPEPAVQELPPEVEPTPVPEAPPGEEPAA